MITVRNATGRQSTIPSQGTVLQSMEQAHVVHRAQCKSGLCGACRCKLKSGSVRYTQEPIGFFRDGEILPCVCIADGDIEIES